MNLKYFLLVWIMMAALTKGTAQTGPANGPQKQNPIPVPVAVADEAKIKRLEDQITELRQAQVDYRQEKERLEKTYSSIEKTDILHRLDLVESEVGWHVKVLVIIFALAGFLGYPEIKKRITRAGKQAGNDAKKFVEAARIEFGELVKAQALGTKIFAETGEVPLTFNNVNYISFWVNFKTRFPRIPQVVVSESVPGEWVYVKIDELEQNKFHIAARSLSGLPINHSTKIQWIALVIENTTRSLSLEAPDPAATPGSNVD